MEESMHSFDVLGNPFDSAYLGLWQQVSRGQCECGCSPVVLCEIQGLARTHL